MDSKHDSVIKAFIEQYKQDHAAYAQLCAAAEKRLKGLLAQKGIMAIVSARVKDPERVEQKLLKRDAERTAAGQEPFRSPDDIFDDIHDLVGARVALYFPGDAVRVEELLTPQFTKVSEKTYPPKAEHYGEMVLTGYTAHKRRIYQGYDDRRFDGYRATHYHVRFSDKPVPALSDVVIEIQVASVLMHAWSEVEHDLAYKKLMGAVSREEYECLDELNGLVMAGELVLNRLDQLSRQRIQSLTTFDSHYALATFLTNWQNEKGCGTRPLGNVEILFESYRGRDVLTTEYVRKQLALLEKLDWTASPVPLAGQLLDLFASQNNRTIVTDNVTDTVLEIGEENPDIPTKAQLDSFQRRWNALEDRVKKSLVNMGQVPDCRTTKLMMVEVDHTLTREFADEFNRLRAIRGQLVYGYLAPSRQDMKTLLDDVDRLSKFLQQEYGV